MYGIVICAESRMQQMDICIGFIGPRSLISGSYEPLDKAALASPGPLPGHFRRELRQGEGFPTKSKKDLHKIGTRP